MSGGEWVGECPGSGEGTGVICMPSWLLKYDSLCVATEARRVSIEGLEPSVPVSPPSLPLDDFLIVLALLMALHVVTMNLVVAFLALRHIDTVSSAVFTLLKSTNLCTGALFNSVSKMVLRQSSIASLIAVTVRMKIRGTAFSAGFEAPKMEKI